LLLINFDPRREINEDDPRGSDFHARFFGQPQALSPILLADLIGTAEAAPFPATSKPSGANDQRL